MNYVAERRQEEKERRREQIVDAAEKVFAEFGFDEASMDKVARASRVSRALLYVYFPDKFALHCAICERALDLLRERFEAASERQATGLDKIRAIGKSYLGFSYEFPHYFNALTRFEAHKAEHIAPQSDEHRCVLAGDRLHQVSAAAVQAGIDDGSIRSDIGEPMLVSITLWGFLHGILQLSYTKANMMARDGIAVQQLMESAMAMCGQALRGDVQTVPATCKAP
jgi:TetR/AcrR family transcriptional regulator